MSHILPQSSPNQGKVSVVPLVMEDLYKRQLFGLKKYGTVLKTENGRDALVDAYQEALDLCCYLKQVLLEREAE